jgi:fluoride exporter
MKEAVLVFIGGGLGSMARFSLGKWITSFHTQHFPYATLAINLLACLVLGIVIGLADHNRFISAPSRLFWTIGFCGGFSTFSTFSAETITLLQAGFHVSSMLYIIGSLVFCLLATYAGLYLGNHIN